MDLSRLGRGEKVALIGTAALLILSFLPLWAKFEAIGISHRATAWDFGIALRVALVLALVILVAGGIRAAGANVSLPVPAWQIYLGGGAVIFLLLVIQVISGVPGSEFGGAFGVELSRGPLLLLSPLLGATIAYGGYLDKSEAEAFPAAPSAPPSQAPPAPPAPPA